MIIFSSFNHRYGTGRCHWIVSVKFSWFFESNLICLSSENTLEGRRVTKLDQILLNGVNVCMVSLSIKKILKSLFKVFFFFVQFVYMTASRKKDIIILFLIWSPVVNYLKILLHVNIIPKQMLPIVYNRYWNPLTIAIWIMLFIEI